MNYHKFGLNDIESETINDLERLMGEEFTKIDENWSDFSTK